MHGSSDFAARHYAPRAAAYATSAVHAAGADLDQIEALLRARTARRALDLGCGGGHVSFRAARHAGEVVACDPTQAMLDAAAAGAAERGLSNLSVRLAAAEDLPFSDGGFDVVLSRYSTHHWHGMEAGLRSARRVLAPGGLAAFVDVVAPVDPACDTHLQTVELLRDPSHVRDYAAAEWAAALARAGFALEGVTMRRVRMEFATWIARTDASPLRADAVRAVQDAAPPHVRAHFAIGEDGGFDLDVATFVARPGPA